MNVDVSLVKIKTEADSNEITDITECSHDDKPSTGMFAESDDIVSSVSCLCILCAVCCLRCYLRAVCRKVLWSSACVCLCVCVSVCLCALFLSARYLKKGFMDHHQIWWVGEGGEPLEQVQFWC